MRNVAALAVFYTI